MATRPNLDNLDFLGRALDFIEMYDFDQELLKDVVRYPTTREKDPHANEVGYPIYRFRRGDITVVCGFKDPEHPHILHVFLHTPDEPDNTPAKAGGAGSKTPATLTQLRGWLSKEGCRLEWTGKGQRVYYSDIFIGTIHGTYGLQTSIKNDYSRLRKKIAGIKAQESLRQDVMNREMK